MAGQFTQQQAENVRGVLAAYASEQAANDFWNRVWNDGNRDMRAVEAEEYRHDEREDS